ncbi:unnamed protein product [Bursaphelenchus okinawaensis]|uniref:Uncharacterized protein n=1 Tax=Bursaphelenchus okinawaensis TaxID=465554 RepID=A0A811LLN6_9BILA|nr:unnamed protein product [Bursaphelenchus okinawaensis]CAG9123715.1 unnamed protein product [Bursaphelenchus okinawaensis]
MDLNSSLLQESEERRVFEKAPTMSLLPHDQTSGSTLASIGEMEMNPEDRTRLTPKNTQPAKPVFPSTPDSVVLRPRKRRSSISRFFSRIFACAHPQKTKGSARVSRLHQEHRNSLTIENSTPRRKNRNSLKTSDDMESIISQDEFTVPPSHNATYLKAGLSPRPTTISNGSETPTSRFVDSKASAEQARAASGADFMASKISVPSIWPSDNASLKSNDPLIRMDSDVRAATILNRAIEDSPELPPRPTSLCLGKKDVKLGAPGMTPMNEVPECKKNALKDASAMAEVHKLLQKFNTKRSADSDDERSVALPKVDGGYEGKLMRSRL